MEGLLTWLDAWLSAAPGLALGAALAWGVLSVVLSPCHLTSIPLVVGYLQGGPEASVQRSFALATVFTAGVLGMLTAVGLATLAAGRVVGSTGAWANYLVAAVLMGVGLVLMDVVPLPVAGGGQLSSKRRGFGGALLLGLVFGIGLGPCAFAFMAPVLAMVFGRSAESPALSAALLAAYGVGYGGIIILAGTFSGWVHRYLAWHQRTKAPTIIKRICGALVVLGGLYMLYKA